MKEIRAHTAIRGIAALLVVIYHYREIIGPNFDRYTSFFEKGYLWVDCFLMLSGFILSYIYGNKPALDLGETKRFFVARFARIYPLHAATLIGLALFAVILPHISHQSTSPNWYTFGLNLFDVHAWGMLDAYDWNFPSWSISVEFAAYLIYPLACLALLRSSRLTGALFLALFILALGTAREHWERLALLHGLPMFLMGMLIYRIPRLPTLVLPLQFGATLFLLLALHFGLSDSLAEICFVALIYSTQWDDGIARHFGGAPLHWLGERSYSIYMLHIPIRILADSFIRIHLGSVAYFVLVLTATLIACSISYRFFEMPMRNIISRRRRQPIGKISLVSVELRDCR
jgi:peptidoglycan/LPS O-acetylase OafA/YrhL